MLNWTSKLLWEKEKLVSQIKDHKINADGKYIIREEKQWLEKPEQKNNIKCDKSFKILQKY